MHALLAYYILFFASQARTKPLNQRDIHNVCVCVRTKKKEPKNSVSDEEYTYTQRELDGTARRRHIEKADQRSFTATVCMQLESGTVR